MEDRIQSISSEEPYPRKYNDFTSNSPPSKVSKEDIEMNKENKIKLEFSSDLDQKLNTVSSIFKIEYPSAKESKVLIADKNVVVATDCKLDLTLVKLENENSKDTDHDLEEGCFGLNELIAKIEPDKNIVTSDTYNDLNVENCSFINEDKGSDADRLEIEAENEGELSDEIYSDALGDFKSETKQDFEDSIAIDDACSELRDQNKLSQQSTESKHGSCTEDGEVQDNDDLEEGEVKDEEGSSNLLQACRFFQRGSCSFGASCRFMHVTDKGLYRMFETKEKECFRAVNANNIREEICFRNVLSVPPPLIPEVIEFRDLAWERGLRLAKEQQKRALQRKSEPDFEEKNLYMNFNESSLHINEKSHSLSLHERHYRRKSIDISTITEKKSFNSCEDKHTGKTFIHRNRTNTIYENPAAKKARLSNDAEWRDPWRRSKSPRKGYRSRSYSSSSASYSSSSSNCSCQSAKYSYHEKKYSYKKSSSKKDCGLKHKSRSPFRRSSPRSYSRSPTSQSMSSSPTERFRKQVYRNPKKLDPSCFASNSRRSASLEKAIISKYGPVESTNPKKNSISPVQKIHSPIKYPSPRITHRSLSRSSTSSSCQSYKTCSRSRSVSSTSSSRSKKSNSFSSHYSITSNYSSKSYSKETSKKRSISPRRNSRSPPKVKNPSATKLSFSLSRTSRKILNFNVPWLKKEQEKITIHYSPKKAGNLTSHHLAKTNFRRNERENITSHNSAKTTFRKNQPENINSRYVAKTNSSKNIKNGVMKPSSLAKSTSVKLSGNKAACMLMQYRNLVDSNAHRGNENEKNLNKSTKNAVTTLNQGTAANKDTTVNEVKSVEEKAVNEGATINKVKEINKTVSAKATTLNKQTPMNMGTSLKNETTPNKEKESVSFETPKKGPRMSCSQLFSQYEAMTKKPIVKSKTIATPKLKNGNASGETKCPQSKKQFVATASSKGTNANLIPNENQHQTVFVHPAKRIVPNSKSRTITMNLLTDVMKPPDKKTMKSVSLAAYKPMHKEKGTSRRDLLLKQLKAVEDAIARKKAKSD